MVLEPMVDRLHLLDERIPIHILHGDQSWISSGPSLLIEEKRKNIFVDIVHGAGHHVSRSEQIAVILFSLIDVARSMPMHRKNLKCISNEFYSIVMHASKTDLTEFIFMFILCHPRDCDILMNKVRSVLHFIV